MIWLVTWVWLNTFMVACPDPPRIPDEFGRVAPRITMTLAVCYETERISYKKQFNNLSAALDFMGRGQQQGDLDDFQLIAIGENGKEAIVEEW